MAKVNVRCLHCKHDKVFRHGLSQSGKQRFRCVKCQKTFLFEYTNQGCLPEIQTKIVDMAINGSGIRDTSRVLNISTTTVISTLKKLCNWVKVNWSHLPANPEAAICIPITVEADEQWSFVQNKSHQRWLWVVLGHHTHEGFCRIFPCF